MNPIRFFGDFRVKDTYGMVKEVIYEARCCLSGDKKVSFREFDPDNLYAPVVRNETIRIFMAKFAAQEIFPEGAHIVNDYLYGDIDVLIIMEQPTYSSGKPLRSVNVCQLYKFIYLASQPGENWGGVLHTKFLSWRIEQ